MSSVRLNEKEKRYSKIQIRKVSMNDEEMVVYLDYVSVDKTLQIL